LKRNENDCESEKVGDIVESGIRLIKKMRRKIVFDAKDVFKVLEKG